MPGEVDGGPQSSTAGATRGSMASLSLRMRFFLGTGLILFFFCSICSYMIYRQGRLLLEEAAVAKARIVMATVEANQNYVRDVLRPRVYDILGQDTFVLEAMSTSFVARAVMDRFNAAMPDYRYRRVAIDARNSNSEANPAEAKMIKYFTAKPEEKDWNGIIEMGDESHFTAFKPVYFRDSCMHCHGPVENAPKDLIELYGSERGFNRKVGEIAGVIAVGIPVNVALSQVRGKALSVFMSSFFIACILFVLISSYFNRLVAHDLRKILHIFRAGLGNGEARQIISKHKSENDVGLGAVPDGLGWADELKYFQEVQGKDEVEEITISARAMAHHLKESRRELERNAENLERTVAERTMELRESEKRLGKQVIARNRELQTLNTLAEMITRADSLNDVLPGALEQAMRLISADGAGLYLFDDRSQTLELQCHPKAQLLTASVPCDTTSCLMMSDANNDDFLFSLREAARGHISFFKNTETGNGLNVPLCCRGRVLGVISFTGLGFEECTPEMHELLFSVGRQIGIAIESLQTIRQLTQSKEVMQSVLTDTTEYSDPHRQRPNGKDVDKANLHQLSKA